MRPRTATRWRTAFGSWVGTYTVPRLCSDLGVTSNAVYSWVAGRHIPDPARASAMVELSRGAISMQQIYQHRTEVTE